MADDVQIAKTLNRVARVFEEKPSTALDTDRASVTLVDGLKCTVRQGEHSAVIDMSAMMGGQGAGPTPGFFGRAALISCIAIGLKMTAVRAGVQFDSINVDVEMDWDHRGLFGIGQAGAGPTEIRVEISVQSPADRSEILAVINDGLRQDPWYQVFQEPQNIDPVIRINEKGAD